MVLAKQKTNLTSLRLTQTTPKFSNDLESEVARLEAELQMYKELKLTKIERKINELLDALDDPATPQTKGQRLRERLGIVAATVALTALTNQAKPEIPLIFQQPHKQEQVSPRFSSTQQENLANQKSTQAPSLAQAPSLDRLMKAIATQESGGRTDLINNDSGASGKWQIMPSNIPSWSQAALGREVGHAEFMASPQLQYTIAKHRLGLYLNQETQPARSEEEIIRRVASLWYSGRSHLWNHTKPQYSNGRQYPSIAQYTTSVWKHYLSVKSPKYASTKAVIEAWSPEFQKDPATGDMIAGYKVTSPRGMRMHPTKGTPKMHQGVDLGTPIGTPIFAIADGTIECTRWDDAGLVGLFTSDKFPDIRFDLLHLNSCTAQLGSKVQVKAGQEIATTGTAGTGPHLHLAIKGLESGNFLRVRAGWLHWFVTGKEPNAS
ncbi:MAG TPA: peptidoglycan DD-metalloendopeptidase family protein [Cyanophyceae cyanobacterium]